MAIKTLSIVALVALVAIAHTKPAERVFHAVQQPTQYELSTGFSSPSVSEVSVSEGAIDLCKTCISFAGQALQQLLNLILNKAVSQTCSTLCNALENATHSKPLGQTCMILCELEGIKAFVNWISKADLSPIYDCQEINVCKYNDNGDAEIVSFDVSPTEGPQGTTFEVQLGWASKNGTGVGEIRFEISTMDHVSLNIPTVYVPNSLTGGSYSVTLNVPAKKDPNCDPSQGPCEQWFFGRYNVSTIICEGECGDTKHPHTSTYAQGKTFFEITKGPGPAPPPPAPGSNPWADPNSGPCPNGEQAVNVNGVAGSFCSPPCTGGSTCPGAPSGVTATPQCALEKSGTTTPNMCALICGGGLSCPPKASCKSIQSTGICTFDS